jgi:hydroxymethylbilane synthase
MIRIGTRKSALALWQANQVKSRLEALGASAVLVPVESEGDQNLTDPLYKMGIQGIFTKTLDAALLNKKIDIAVHSLKDVPTILAEGIEISAVLSRGSSQDVIAYHPQYAVNSQKKIIGTGSLRRKAQWLRKYPDFKVENLRGNVQKRLEKLVHSSWTGAIFAQAGVERLGLLGFDFKPLTWMIPAPAQGAIGIASLDSNTSIQPYLKQINSTDTALCTEIERTFLNTLEGGCTAPIGANAKIEGTKLIFNAGLFSLDGKQAKVIEEEIPIDDAKGFGIQAANKILNQGGASLLEKIKSQMTK